MTSGMRWVENVASMERKPERQSPLGRPSMVRRLILKLFLKD
jgi:hypothetical protein